MIHTWYYLMLNSDMEKKKSQNKTMFCYKIKNLWKLFYNACQIPFKLKYIVFISWKWFILVSSFFLQNKKSAMVLEKVGFENLRMCKYREKSNPNINTLGIGSFEGYRPPRVIQLRVEKLINKTILKFLIWRPTFSFYH